MRSHSRLIGAFIGVSDSSVLGHEERQRSGVGGALRPLLRDKHRHVLSNTCFVWLGSRSSSPAPGLRLQLNVISQGDPDHPVDSTRLCTHCFCSVFCFLVSLFLSLECRPCEDGKLRQQGRSNSRCFLFLLNTSCFPIPEVGKTLLPAGFIAQLGSAVEPDLDCGFGAH